MSPLPRKDTAEYTGLRRDGEPRWGVQRWPSFLLLLLLSCSCSHARFPHTHLRGWAVIWRSRLRSPLSTAAPSPVELLGLSNDLKAREEGQKH